MSRSEIANVFSERGIDVSTEEVDQVHTANSALFAESPNSELVARRKCVSFDKRFSREKDCRSPVTNTFVSGVLLSDEWPIETAIDMCDEVQERFSPFVEILDPPYGMHRSSLPIAIKDVFSFGDITPSVGVPNRSSTIDIGSSSSVVNRLVSAGAAIVGTTSVPTWCYLALEYNPLMPTPVNPLGDDLLVGGSSSGSAVCVASGLVPAAIGTDTGGSVKIPAALCGVYGFKSTVGRIPLDGIMPLGKTQDTVGLLASEMTYIKKVFNVIKSDHVVAKGQPEIVGKPAIDNINCDPEIVEAIALMSNRLSEKGIKIVDCPQIPLDQANRCASILTGYEASRFHRDGITNNPHEYVAAVRDRLLLGISINDSQYREALLKRGILLNYVLDEIFGECEFLIFPTVGYYAPKRSECDANDQVAVGKMGIELLNLNRWVNLLGLPAITVPVVIQGKSIPSSVQVVGKPYCDEALIQLVR